MSRRDDSLYYATSAVALAEYRQVTAVNEHKLLTLLRHVSHWALATAQPAKGKQESHNGQRKDEKANTERPTEKRQRSDRSDNEPNEHSLFGYNCSFRN